MLYVKRFVRKGGFESWFFFSILLNIPLEQLNLALQRSRAELSPRGGLATPSKPGFYTMIVLEMSSSHTLPPVMPHCER